MYKSVVQRLATNKGEREEEKRREISVALFREKYVKLHNTKPWFMRKPMVRRPAAPSPNIAVFQLRGIDRGACAIRFMFLEFRKDFEQLASESVKLNYIVQIMTK